MQPVQQPGAHIPTVVAAMVNARTTRSLSRHTTSSVRARLLSAPSVAGNPHQAARLPTLSTDKRFTPAVDQELGVRPDEVNVPVDDQPLDGQPRTALVAAVKRALEPTASTLLQEVLCSRHDSIAAGARLGLVVLQSQIEPGLAWAALASQTTGAWAVLEWCELILDSQESERSFDSTRHHRYALRSRWLAYGGPSPSGALVAWNANPERITALRSPAVPPECFVVQPTLLVTVVWDVARPDFHSWLRPRNLELRRGEANAWEPSAELPGYLVSQNRFVDAYRRHSRSYRSDDEDFWAWEAVFSTWDHRDKLALVRLLVESTTEEEHEHLGGLGAGPLEDMASDWLLDSLGPHIVSDRRWLYALATVRDFSAGGLLTQRFSPPAHLRHEELAAGQRADIVPTMSSTPRRQSTQHDPPRSQVSQ